MEAQIDAAALLEQHDVRPTRQRVAVVEALAAEPNDATAQEIHERLRERVGLATVYRTLTLLAGAGVIDTLNHRSGEACYRLCGEGHHHHLVCGQCHRVVELGDCDLEGHLSRIAATHGFTVSSHTVELTGLCADCR